MALTTKQRDELLMALGATNAARHNVTSIHFHTSTDPELDNLANVASNALNALRQALARKAGV